MKRKLIGLLLGSCVSHYAFAAVPSIPASVNPDNIINTFNKTPVVLEEPKPVPLLDIELGASAQESDLEPASGSTMILKKVELLGVKHPLPANVMALYNQMIGQEVGFKEMRALAARMEKTYRGDGYILVQVILPPQEISLDDGVLKLQIVEGKIQNVIFTGDDPRSAGGQLKRYAAKITAEDLIQYQTLDRFLALANRIPGLQVSATVEPNPKVVGGADLIIHVNKSYTAAFINLNNRGTQYIGRGQGVLGGSVYNLFGADSISLQGATSTSNPQQLKYGKVGYDLVWGSYGADFNASMSSSASHPGSSLSSLDMNGVSTQYELGINQPLIVSTRRSLILESALTHIHSYSNLFQENVQLYEDHITALSLGLHYEGVLFKSHNDVMFSITKGLPVLGAASSENSPSIIHGKTDFFRLNLVTSTIRYFTQNTSVSLGTQVQWTTQTMLASQQMAYGGQTFGQAFLPYVISGDNAYMASLALRYDLPTFTHIHLLQPEIFYDMGIVTLNQPADGVAHGASAQSAGVGLNIGFLKHWQLSILLAKPIRITQTPTVDRKMTSFLNLTGVF